MRVMGSLSYLLQEGRDGVSKREDMERFLVMEHFGDIRARVGDVEVVKR